jgi:nonsense-mediated mRNA decay protein 3
MLVVDESHMPTILCCMCGIEITQNPANMCVACLREHTDITEGIQRSVTIYSCRSCGRFLAPPWQNLQLESKELLAMCMRKLSGVSGVKVVDAVWIWTEPHSLRLKIKLTIQKEVINGAILQQALVVDYIIRNKQCKSCEAAYAQGAWHAVVQVRQRVLHKRTFLFLEQLLLKYNAHAECIRIVTFKDGMDFYFSEKNVALRFIDFLESHVPIKVKYSRKLVTADHKANTGDFKHNHMVEISPICKDDLVILPQALAANLSNISPLVLCKRIAAGIHIIDPFTSERQEINMEKYWRYGFFPALSTRQLTKFIVLAVEPLVQEVRASAKVRGHASKKMRMAEVTVAR